MKDRSVNSYDLKQAQQILSSLAPIPTAAPGAEVSQDTPVYLRLSKESLPQKAAPVTALPADAPKDAAEPSVDMQPQKFTSWEGCLGWCLGLTRAEAGFVVDSQGFIIASRGRVPGYGFEGTGAEMVCSVEQLERIAPDAGKLLWVDLDFDKRRIVGFVTPQQNSQYYVIGLISPEPAYHSIKHFLTSQIIENLPNLD
jgi:hypothetical protein